MAIDVSRGQLGTVGGDVVVLSPSASVAIA